MEGSIENYIKIHNRILGGFLVVVVLFVLTSLESVEVYLTQLIGEYNLYLLKLVPWGGFGALLRAAYFSASDKNDNYKGMARARDGDHSEEAPDYPDAHDVAMYLFYILSGCVLAVLSAFLLQTGIAYVGENVDKTQAIREKYPLFVIFAFYAGYSQSALIRQLQSKAKQA